MNFRRDEKRKTNRFCVQSLSISVPALPSHRWHWRMLCALFLRGQKNIGTVVLLQHDHDEVVARPTNSSQKLTG